MICPTITRQQNKKICTEIFTIIWRWNTATVSRLLFYYQSLHGSWMVRILQLQCKIHWGLHLDREGKIETNKIPHLYSFINKNKMSSKSFKHLNFSWNSFIRLMRIIACNSFHTCIIIMHTSNVYHYTLLILTEYRTKLFNLYDMAFKWSSHAIKMHVASVSMMSKYNCRGKSFTR